MLNQVVMVGRLTSDLEINEVDGKKVCSLTLAIPRNYKNKDGEYDKDFINVMLWNSVAEDTAKYCHKGDIIGVKGRLESEVLEKEDGTTKTLIRVIAEKVTFLSSRKPEEEEC